MRYWKLPLLKKTGNKHYLASEMILNIVLAREEWRTNLDSVRRHAEVYDALEPAPPPGTVIELQDGAHELLVRHGMLKGIVLSDPAENREYMRIYESILLAPQSREEVEASPEAGPK